MDILQNIVYPQSPTHILLLNYLLFLTLLILLPYLSVMISTTLFSLMHFHKGRKSVNNQYLIFAQELIDMFTLNKGMAFTLGIVPFLSIIFIFSQLLLNSTLNLTANLVFTLTILISALLCVYAYKYSFRLKNIFNLINISYAADEYLLEEFKGLQKSNSRLLVKSGVIGLFLLLVVAYILVSVLQIVEDTSRWTDGNSLSSILLSVNSFLYFLFYLTFSFSITCSAILYKYFKRERKKHSEDYLNYVKSFALKTGLIFTFIQPLLFVLTVLSSPQSSLSFTMFMTTGIILLVMLSINVIFYIMYKESKTNLGGSLVFVFLILISLIIYKDQVAFETASEAQIYNLNKEYELFAAKVKEDAGISEVVEISGEDIFNGKCIACHRFDKVLVGPAYNDVLPKYEGKREELIDFILNPRKINPEFTIMPNQGLRPKEAEAIADYIVKVYKKNNN